MGSGLLIRTKDPNERGIIWGGKWERGRTLREAEPQVGKWFLRSFYSILMKSQVAVRVRQGGTRKGKLIFWGRSSRRKKRE